MLEESKGWKAIKKTTTIEAKNKAKRFPACLAYISNDSKIKRTRLGAT